MFNRMRQAWLGWLCVICPSVQAATPLLNYSPAQSNPAAGTYVFYSSGFTSGGAANVTLKGWDQLNPPNTVSLTGSATGGWTMWYGGLSKIAFETTLEQDGTFTVYATPNMAGDIQWSRSAGGGGTVTITAPVPEPAGWAWTGGLALAGWGLWRRRKGR